MPAWQLPGSAYGLRCQGLWPGAFAAARKISVGVGAGVRLEEAVAGLASPKKLRMQIACGELSAISQMRPGERIMYKMTPALMEEMQSSSGVADRRPIACEPFVRWWLEDKFPGGRPAFDSVLNERCLFVEDTAPFAELQVKVFEGARQAIAYAGLLRGFRTLQEACANQVLADFLDKYLAVVMEHAVQPPPALDLASYKEVTKHRLSQSGEELLDLARDGCSKLHRNCMSCLPFLPKMDTAAVKPLVVLLCFWVRYLAFCKDESETPYAHAADARLSELQPLAETLWQNAVKSVRGEDGEVIRRQPPREEAKALVLCAFPDTDLGPTVLVEVLASQIINLRANDVDSFLTSAARL
ncbi:unnamed protein product [Effrenium voratum]|uniref:Mannitol dehydrogenase C-terminal domain-containing protein n=1 Tax=Effrenium voratum TaxID=2562239 RepID=A0AA36JFH1_9DINO|nr:unnamed protein product [Effrenium voratum]